MKYANKVDHQAFKEFALKFAKEHLNCDENDVVVGDNFIKCKSNSTGKIVHIHMEDFNVRCSDSFVRKIVTREWIKFLYEKFGKEYYSDLKNYVNNSNIKDKPKFIQETERESM